MATPEKPTVIGLFGVPGCGKTFLLDRFRQNSDSRFIYYEGSDLISRVVPSGLDAFKRMPAEAQSKWQEKAIFHIQDECRRNKRTGLVTGDYMHWEESHEVGKSLVTSADLSVYTHILYLDIPADLVLQRQGKHATRDYPKYSENHIRRWQEAEKRELTEVCLKNGILLMIVPKEQCRLWELDDLIYSFHEDNEAHQLYLADLDLDRDFQLAATTKSLKRALVFDADHTLTDKNLSDIWWEHYFRSKNLENDVYPLKALSAYPKSSFMALRQATMLYQSVTSEEEFIAICQSIAEKVKIHEQFAKLLSLASTHNETQVFILTSGLSSVWNKVLDMAGLSNHMRAIGTNRVKDGPVMTPEVKAHIVKRLQDAYYLEVWAFGSSSQDIPMLIQADRAFVVIGQGPSGISKKDEDELEDAVRQGKLSVQQIVPPSCLGSCLDKRLVPKLDLEDQDFLTALFGPPVNVLHATEKGAGKLLAMPMMDDSFTGALLQKAHQECGRYLALEYVSDLVGVEPNATPNGQANTTRFSLAQEDKTLILARREGSPMAFGVKEAFPRAKCVRVRSTQEMTYHLQRYSRVLLVEPVINSRNREWTVQWLKHIRKFAPSIPVIVIVGVVQAEEVAPNSEIGRSFGGQLTVVTLRLSEDNSTGNEGEDLEDRLYHTLNFA